MKNRFLTRVMSNIDARSETTFSVIVGKDFTHEMKWSDLAADARRFSGLLRANGLRRGDQLLIFLEFGPRLYGAFLGAMMTGVVPSFMPTLTNRQNPDLFWKSHDQLLRQVRPAGILASSRVFDEMREAGLDRGASRDIRLEDLPASDLGEPDFPGEEDVALLQHSSGTTGLKKGVALSYAAITRQLDSYGSALKLGPDDKIVSWLPLYHDMGLVACFLLPLYRGLSIRHIDPQHWVSRPHTLFDALHATRRTFTWMPNFAFEHLAATVRRQAERYDLSGVEAFINCSEPCKTLSFDRFLEAFGPAGVRPEQLQCCYAMAETTFAAAQTPLGAPPRRVRVDRERLAMGQRPLDPNGATEVVESGRALEGVEIEIFDENRAKVADGIVGEIGLAGDFLFTEYNAEPERTRAQLHDGVYYSRDLGFRHEGCLYVLGRKDDVIIVNGRKLFAHEVEEALTRIVGIRPGRAVAASLPSERTGTGELVIIAERDPAAPRDEAAIRGDIVTTVFSIFAVQPKAVALREPGSLVKTTSGKISRGVNLARYLAEQV